MRLIILFSLLLTACASTGDVYASAVDEVVHLNKPVDDVSKCLQLRLSEAPITTPEGAATFLVKNQYGATLGMLTLTPADEGTDIAIRRTQGLVSTGMWRKCR